MSEKMFRGVLYLAAVLAMGLPGVLSAETIARPEVKLPTKCDGKPADMTKPVKVFIMMGQSNMVGFGATGPEGTPGTLETLVKKEGKYPFMAADAGKWMPRSDVRCVFVLAGKRGGERTGWLQPSFGARGNQFGPELGFGYVIGQTLNEPVLLIKACCGNRSLGWDYLPPGSQRYEFVKTGKDGGKAYVGAGYKDRPDSWEMDKAKGKATEPPQWIDKKTGKPIEWYAGKQYDDDVANAKAVLADIGKYYPGATKYEVAGFVWWQGHKDQNPWHASRYEVNLVNLIKALRKEFNAPNAPFVLATGCGNPGTESFGLQIAQAQLAMNDATKHPEFAGNVKCIDSRGFWPKPEESPSKQGYHYFWNAGTYMDVGLSLGWAMVELLGKNGQ